MRRHRSQEVVGERAADGSGADGGGRFQLLANLLETTNVLKVFRVELLLMSNTTTLTILRSTTHDVISHVYYYVYDSD